MGSSYTLFYYGFTFVTHLHQFRTATRAGLPGLYTFLLPIGAALPGVGLTLVLRRYGYELPLGYALRCSLAARTWDFARCGCPTTPRTAALWFTRHTPPFTTRCTRLPFPGLPHAAFTGLLDSLWIARLHTFGYGSHGWLFTLPFMVTAVAFATTFAALCRCLVTRLRCLRWLRCWLSIRLIDSRLLITLFDCPVAVPVLLLVILYVGY